jgi:hypothetical protein
VILTLILAFLAVLVAYYILGAPVLDYIHRFVKEFTHSFPLWTLFGLDPLGRAGAGDRDEAGAARRD